MMIKGMRREILFRFSPCFFLYICTMIPPIWFLEINRINGKLGRAPTNQTEGDELKSMIEKGLISKANLNDQTVCIRTKAFSLSLSLSSSTFHREHSTL